MADDKIKVEIELIKQKIEHVDERLTNIDSKLDDLISFKFKIMGGIIVISALMSLGLKLFKIGG